MTQVGLLTAWAKWWQQGSILAASEGYFRVRDRRRRRVFAADRWCHDEEDQKVSRGQGTWNISGLVGTWFSDTKNLVTTYWSLLGLGSNIDTFSVITHSYERCYN